MTQTTSSLSANLHSYYRKMLLDVAEKQLKLKQFAAETLHPKGNGKDYFLLRYGNITPDDTASAGELTEGVTPSESSIATNKYTVTAKHYGRFIKSSDFLQLTAIDPVMESFASRLGYHAAASMDSKIRSEIETNSFPMWVGTGNAADNDIAATDIFTTRDVIRPVRHLKAQDAPQFDDGSYVCLVHSNTEMDIISDTAAGGFIELNKYVEGLADKPLKGEIGKAYGARFVVTNQISVTPNATPVNVYGSLILAKDPVAMSKFNKNAVEIITKQLGSGGDTDPLNQRSSVGYKMFFGLKYVGGTFSGANGASPDLAVRLASAATES